MRSKRPINSRPNVTQTRQHSRENGWVLAQKSMNVLSNCDCGLPPHQCGKACLTGRLRLNLAQAAPAGRGVASKIFETGSGKASLSALKRGGAALVPHPLGRHLPSRAASERVQNNS